MDVDDSWNAERAQDDLRFIRQTLAETRSTVVQRNPLFFLWGGVIWLEVGITYMLVLVAQLRADPGPIGLISIIWLVLSSAAAAITVQYVAREGRTPAPAVTLADRAAGAVWFGALFSLGLVSFAGPFALLVRGVELDISYAMAAVSAILALPFMLMGTVYELTEFRRIAIALWAGALLMMLLDVAWSTLVYGAVVGTGFLYGGVVLRKQAGPDRA